MDTGMSERSYKQLSMEKVTIFIEVLTNNIESVTQKYVVKKEKK